MTREEAIKILRDTHDKALFSVRNALETLIPELIESEDERMIDAIKRAVIVASNEGGYLINAITREDALAWLEKQKEQKLAEWSDYKDKIHIPYCSSESEWSEENKETIRDAINRIEQLDHYWNRPRDEKLIQRLKSLRPQPKQETE